jgi:NitT/TauT family transport system permease protein
MNDLETTAIVDDDEIEERRIRRCSAIWRWALGIGLVLGWEVLTRLKIIDPYFFSNPTTIVNTAYIAATQGSLYVDIGYTSASTIVGFLIGVTAGAVLGLSTWWSQVYGRVSEPYLVTFNAIPKLALAPILIILLGIGFQSKVALAVALTIVPAALAAYGGVKSVDKDLETLLSSLGASRPGLCQGRCYGRARSSVFVSISDWRWPEQSSLSIASRYGVAAVLMGQIMDINLVWVGVVVCRRWSCTAVTTVGSLLKGMLTDRNSTQ